MPEKKPVKKAAKAESARTGLSEQEKAAMKERMRELKAEARSSGKRADGEKELLAKIAELPQPDRGMTERIHAIVSEVAPGLWPKTWYGMPAWAKDGKVVCFFQPASKFDARYATFGFNDPATLDAGNMWPTSFAVIKLTAAEEKKIAALVKKAAKP